MSLASRPPSLLCLLIGAAQAVRPRGPAARLLAAERLVALQPARAGPYLLLALVRKSRGEEREAHAALAQARARARERADRTAVSRLERQLAGGGLEWARPVERERRHIRLYFTALEGAALGEPADGIEPITPSLMSNGAG
jgi:hypothetical protein